MRDKNINMQPDVSVALDTLLSTASNIGDLCNCQPVLWKIHEATIESHTDGRS